MAVKSQGNGTPNATTAQLPKPPQTKTPALPAEQFARAAWLPEEAGLPGPTISPAMQCALLSGPPAKPSLETTSPTAHCVTSELFALAYSQAVAWLVHFSAF